MKKRKDSKKFIIGVDLGGTKVAAGIIDEKGKVIEKAKELTDVEGGPQSVINQMIDMVERLIDKKNLKLSQIKGIGIGAAGPLDTKRGIIVTPPNLPGWYNVQLVKPFKKRFKVPVYLNNDANAACLGERWFGAGKGTRNMVYLTISTGIGGGAIIDGKLYQGANDNACELGHITIDVNGPLCGCGNYGCLEAHSSGKAIARWAKEAVKKEPETLILEYVSYDIERIDAKTVFDSAKKGDRVALEVVNKAGEFLGIGIASIINAFNPEKVVLGGGVVKGGNLLLDKVREIAKSRSMKALASVVEIVPSKLGDDVGIIGAATLVLASEYEN